MQDKREQPEDQKSKLLDRLTPQRAGNIYLRLQNQARESTNNNLLLAMAIVSFFIPGGFLVALFPAFSGRGGAQALGIISACTNFAASIIVWSMTR